MGHDHPLVELDDVRMWFRTSGGALLDRHAHNVKAVDGVSLKIHQGETVGLVGESGCGKSTLGRLVVRLYRPTGGRVIVDGIDITRASDAQLRPLRARMQMMFQDPFSSLDPRYSVERTIAEPLSVHRSVRRCDRSARVRELLDLVGLPVSALDRFPHEFSGGQRQRIGLARALALDPALVVCDEPVSALDVSIQAQILNLLQELQERLQLTYLFIAHDLAVVRHISDRVVVMYLGKVVESASCTSLYENPLHPYTNILLSAVPVPDPAVERARRAIRVGSDAPTVAGTPRGCSFHTRCPYVQPTRCLDEEPTLRDVAGHQVACHYTSEIRSGRIPPASTVAIDGGTQDG